MDIKIRKATKDDYSRLMPLFEQGDALHREHHPDLFREPQGPPRTKDYFDALIESEDVAIFIAEEEGSPIGLIQVFLRSPADIPILVPRKFAVIDNIIVDENYRGGGVGRQLMHKAHEWAMEKNAYDVELNVYDFNQGALSLYESMGYRIVSHRMSKPLRD